MLKKILFFSLIASAALFFGCSDSEQPPQDANKMVSSTLFKLADTDSKPYTVAKEGNNFILENSKKQIVLYDVFATWCAPCRASAPGLARLQKKFTDDLIVLGITIEEDKSNKDFKEYKQKVGADYTIVNSSDNQRLARAIASAIKVGQRFPIPMVVLYKNGKYVTHYVGSVPEEMLESDIKKALGR